MWTPRVVNSAQARNLPITLHHQVEVIYNSPVRTNFCTDKNLHGSTLRLQVTGGTGRLCRGQIGLKFIGTSAYRTLADFLSRLTAISLGAESISAMFEKRPVQVFSLAEVRACPDKLLSFSTRPHTSRQGPTLRRFEIKYCQISPDKQN